MQSGSPGPGDDERLCDDEGGDESDNGESAYERERRANIARNQEKLRELGIEEDHDLRPAKRPRNMRSKLPSDGPPTQISRISG